MQALLNTAVGTGEHKVAHPLPMIHNGVDPDPDADYDPTNNDVPTPLEFDGNLFNPPKGIKTYNNAVSQAGMVMSDQRFKHRPDSNQMSDPIPSGTTFLNDGVPSGYDLPTGELPEGSTASGVSCTADPLSVLTTTTYCYYEGPTLEFPRGRIIWEGTLGPDLGASNAEQAINEMVIGLPSGLAQMLVLFEIRLSSVLTWTVTVI